MKPNGRHDHGAPLLEVQALTIALPAGSAHADAVRELTFAVARGEILCLLGETGAGKSLVAQQLMGLLPGGWPPVDGRIRLGGEDVTQPGGARLGELRAARMSLVGHEPVMALAARTTCGEQIDEALRRHTRLSGAERRAKVLAALAGAALREPERVAASFAHQLSRGERRRVMLALALVLEPALLIADEPTAGLDAATQARMLELVRDRATRHDAGVLWLTRDAGIAAEIADRVGVLHQGRLVELGARDDVLQRPQHEATRRLLAAAPTLQVRERAVDSHAQVVLRVQGLAKSYADPRGPGAGREVQAVRNVSFEIRRGQTLGLVGDSGAGKSTVARCVVRLVDPGAGSIRLGPDEIGRLGALHVRALRRRVQYLFEDPYRALDPRQRIRDAMIEGPVNFGMPHKMALDRAADLLEMVGLPTGALDQHPHRFDGGERQRICIARALMLEPDLLVADEALSALDGPAQAHVAVLFDEIRRRLQVAMLFVTRDLRLASRVCDELAVMSRGEIVEQGPAHRVLGDPQHAATRALIAATPGKGYAFGG